MILRSRKVVIKRHKHSSPNRFEIKEEREDFISRLPDELLTHILSMLPESDANRTRILSNRWKDLWAFLPNLHFVMPFCWSIEEINKVHNSVDQTLALRGGMPIQRFYLYCSKNCDYTRVSDWIITVVKCNVHELELRFPADRITVRFCWDLFKNCNTLVALTLRGEFVLNVPEDELIFPCLKKINLVSIVYSSDQAFVNLITGCPVLEELFVERQVIGGCDNMETFKVFSLSLKRLRISFALCANLKYKVVIDAPNLEFMYLLDVMSTDYTLTKPLYIVEAYVRTNSDAESVAQLVVSLTSVKILTLTDTTLMALSYVHNLQIPEFTNLTKLMIGIDIVWGWSLLPVLLNKMPNLEHITFTDGLVPFPRTQHIFNLSWNPPMEPPACLRFKLKEITILNQEALAVEEYPLIEYLLKHSNKLKIFAFRIYKIDKKKRQQSINFYRSSSSCQLKFV